MNYVVDASVWISDLLPRDVNHSPSKLFFDHIRNRKEPQFGPTLLLVECGGAVARSTRNVRFGAAAVAIIETTASLTLYDLSKVRARRSAELAANHFLRGADAIYIQVAEETGSTLITWDAEMISRAPTSIAAMTPADWLSANPI